MCRLVTVSMGALLLLLHSAEVPAEERVELQLRLDGGLPPEEYSAAEATYGALAAAYDIVVNFPVAATEDS